MRTGLGRGRGSLKAAHLCSSPGLLVSPIEGKGVQGVGVGLCVVETLVRSVERPRCLNLFTFAKIDF